jgi:predicted ribosome quality control (RQC) complex YloA/Tae2 family protein
MRVIGTADFTMRDPSVIDEAQVEASGQDSGDQLDKAGQSILRLLQKAAGVAEENSRYAMETAHKLSQQLRAAEDRIARLEAEIEEQRDRAARAEQWLHNVYLEIEDRFLREKK